MAKCLLVNRCHSYCYEHLTSASNVWTSRQNVVLDKVSAWELNLTDNVQTQYRPGLCSTEGGVIRLSSLCVSFFPNRIWNSIFWRMFKNLFHWEFEGYQRGPMGQTGKSKTGSSVYHLEEILSGAEPQF